jgi:hypothetical protein
MGLEAYSTRKLPEPKCITEIPAPRELLRLIAASLPLAHYDHAGFTDMAIGVHPLLPEVDLHLPEVDDDHLLSWAISLLKKKALTNFSAKT